jgi:gas vesicle protein
MFKNILKLLSGTPLGIIGNIINALPIVLMVGIVLWGGHHLINYLTKDLKNKVTQQGIVIKDLGDTNKDLKENVIKIDKSKDLTIEIIENKIDQQKKISKKVSNIESVLDKKIKEIDKVYEDSPKAVLDIENHADQLSSAEIDSIWQTYCLVVPDNPQCKE